MKKTINFNNICIIVVCILTVFSFTGCEKEKIFPTRNMQTFGMSNEIELLYRQMPTRNYSSVSIVGDNILKFQSINHYNQVCQQLKEDCLLWDSLFYNAYGDLGELELMDWMDSIGYDEYLPILMFENILGVSNTRLFDYQITAIKRWSENGFSGNNPTDHIFIYEWEQALYNEYREICVGDTIYQFREDATITIPLKKIKRWLEIRTAPTEALLVNTDVVAKDISFDGYSAFEKVPFKCYDDGEFNANDLPEVFSGLDYSYWIVAGKVGFWGQENRLDCKLVNYKLHKIRKNGKKVFKKVKRTCCIQTLAQYFYKEQYPLFGNNLLYTDVEFCQIPAPVPQLQKVATGEAWVFVVPTIVTNKPVKYVRGVFKYPTLYIHISGSDLYPVVDLHQY